MADRNIASFSLDGCGADTCSPLATVWVGNVTGGPIVPKGLLIAGTNDGHVTAFELPAST